MTPTAVAQRILRLSLAIVMTGCGAASPATTDGPAPAASGSDRAAPASTASTAPGPTDATLPTAAPWHFPVASFTWLRDGPVSRELAAILQDVLDASADGVGLTATVISRHGTWHGATGRAAGSRRMVPPDQMGIGSITKTIVAAQVMQLVDAGELSLEDRAADRLPPDLAFDTNGATIADLLSMRSGISEYFADEEGLLDALTKDPLRVWTTEEKLATVDPKRGPVGPDREWEYLGTNYLLLGLILEQVTGRPVAEVLRRGVLSGDEYARLIYQPDERPSEPMAMPRGASTDVFDQGGGYLPSIANATMFTTEGAMASDAGSLARWFRDLCAGRIVPSAVVDEMTDLRKRPEYGLGIWDRRYQYGSASGAIGHTGLVREGYRAAAFCIQQPVTVVVVLANDREHDVETTAGELWNEAVRD